MTQSNPSQVKDESIEYPVNSDDRNSDDPIESLARPGRGRVGAAHGVAQSVDGQGYSEELRDAVVQ